jgi:predicted nucleic acid-binding Zn ribbon protein
MPFYDFRCEECDKLVEDEFFKLADEKKIECCGIQMKQAFLKAPGLSDPGGIGQKWTNDGYQMRDEKSGNLRNVTEKWERGKNVIRGDVHKSDPGHDAIKKLKLGMEKDIKRLKENK